MTTTAPRSSFPTITRELASVCGGASASEQPNPDPMAAAIGALPDGFAMIKQGGKVQRASCFTAPPEVVKLFENRLKGAGKVTWQACGLVP